MTAPAQSASEWVSFIAADGDTWLFDLSFFSSNWNCIYGSGCAGIEAEVDVEGQRGCCSYGAHFADDADLTRVMKVAEVLPPHLWQHHHARTDLDEPTLDKLTEALTDVDDDGDRVTAVVDGACVFLNRPGFEAGAGCAIHLAALSAELEPLEWKPEVCWQLPIRVEHHLDDNDQATHLVRQWTRKDWGEAGEDLAWWCSEAQEAFSGDQSVAKYVRAEIAALAGESVADALISHVDGRGRSVSVPFPVSPNR
ncbi:MAG: hypothetical protein R8J94_18730 [Acidimicrobiia bacterium]|nr:hypothetical protein [Acidimicrobiia bacterium]